MIFNFFPNSIDKVPAEIGALFIGDNPIFVEQSHHDLTENLFGTDNKEQSGIEMGAQQCIIVRSEEVKRKLQARLPIALILTVMESKGMEFEDVLIYNFFSDSEFSRWRLAIGEGEAAGYHGFDEKRDHALCSELKMLYVAVSRAKCQLFFIDDSVPRNPLITLWKDNALIDVSYQLHFAKGSSIEEWNQRGDEFFARDQYNEALICYKRSKNEPEIQKCNSYVDRNTALTLKAERKSNGIYQPLFIKSGEGFESLNMFLDASQCYLDGGQPM
jgi:ATP-dependent exoDNAse (exonuclease V) beta subunit